MPYVIDTIGGVVYQFIYLSLYIYQLIIYFNLSDAIAGGTTLTAGTFESVEIESLICYNNACHIYFQREPFDVGNRNS